MEVVIVGGFERSGHDSMAEALAAEGLRRGHGIRNWVWRDQIDGIGDHLIFNLHRQAGRMGDARIADVMANEHLVAALLNDLVTILERSWIGRAEAILSVHPWATLALARWLQATPAPLLIDCHSDFTPYPVFAHPRVNAFVGACRPRLLSAEVSRRLQPLGLPVRRSFNPPVNARRNRTLVVNAGSDAWAVQHVGAVVPFVAELLKPDEVILLAPTADAAKAWEAEIDASPARKVVMGVTDIGPLLCHATWFLTKAGGTPLAEGLVAGCTVLAMRTGIPWEDDGLAWLAMRGNVIPVDDAFPSQWSELLIKQGVVPSSELRQMLADSVHAIWRHVEAGSPLAPVDDVVGLAERLIVGDTALEGDPLPATSRELRRILEGWRNRGNSTGC